MAALSPKLKAALGAAVAFAGFTLMQSVTGGEDVSTELFESPLAFADEGDNSVPTTWSTPPVTRNPFASAGLFVDTEAVDEVLDEEVAEPDSSAETTTSTVPRGEDATIEGSDALAEIINNRVPLVSTTEVTE